MRFEIEHLTRYRYSHPVKLERHILRLMPRCDANQQLLAQVILITPEPSRQYDIFDAWGNAVRIVFFNGETDLLEIGTHMKVLTRANNRQEFYDDGMKIPPDYGNETNALRAYLEQIESEQIMEAFTRELRERSGDRLMPLLEILNDCVSKFYQQDLRMEGVAHSPGVTLRIRAGVCRDLALLFIAACRHLGIASRFVSGYQKKSASANHHKRYLHAWAEVYLPYQGWRGYDQTHASSVDDAHVAIACGAKQAATMPVEGSYSFLGTPPESTLEYDLRIHTQLQDSW